MQLFRQAFRSLLREPLILALAVFALGLGIGLPTAMFSLLDAAVLRGLPVPEPREVVNLERRTLGRSGEGFGAQPQDYVVWRDARSFESVAAFTSGTATVRSGTGSERLDVARLTASAFPLLGASAALGRVFGADDERANAEPAVLLSDAAWRDRFQSDPTALGRTLLIGGVAHTIVGVMPPSFGFPAQQELWLPLPVEAMAATNDETTIQVFARLADGVKPAAARAEMEVVAQRMAQLDPEGHAGEEITVKPFTERFMGETATRQMWIVLAAVLLVLVVACTNVAGLLLVRAVRRSNEMAVHSALGAGRATLIKRLLAESAVVAAFGGLAGAAITVAALAGLRAIVGGSTLPYWVEMRIDLRVLLFAVGATMAAAVLAGVLPALKATSGDLARRIYDASRGSSGLRVGRVMQALVVVEVALSLGLLVATGAMVRSVASVQNDDLGLPGDEVAVARVTLPEETPAPQRAQFLAALEADIRAQPGVADAALATSVPATHGTWRRYSIEGETYVDDDARPSVRTAIVSPTFFSLFDRAPVRGRAFDERDDADGVPVAIVTSKFARHHFGEADAIGRRIRVADEEEWRTVVGIVPELWIGGLDASGDRNPRGLYLPLAQSNARSVVIALRAGDGAGLALLPALRAAVARIDPDVPVYDTQSMTAVVATSGWHYGLVTGILGACGLSAMLLATIGLYGIIAFSVGQRTREFGVRMAAGATPGHIILHVLKRGGAQLAIGTVIGYALAVLLTRALAGLLFDVSPGDPLTFIAAGVLLASVALAAMMVPATRAARLDPLEALRAD